MRKYWLLDQHGGDGPTALVYTDGSMHIVEVLRFGPGITELDDQQAVWDSVIGKLAPTMKPLVDASSIEVESVEPHANLRRDANTGLPQTSRAFRRGADKGGRSGRVTGGPSRRGGRGDR
ncbi:MAG: hypothetical protein ACN4GZ_08580 [Acidimicrobiales bacterium]